MDRLRLSRPVFCCLGHVMTKKRNWKAATQLVHSGTLRSQHGEASAYATEHHVAARVLPAPMFAHDRIVTLFGS